MNKQKFVLHLGYPKTGTTSLQHNLLEHHANIDLIGNPFGSFDSAYVELEKDLLITDSLFFNEKIDNIANVLFQRVKESKEKIPLISREQLLHSNKYPEYGGQDIGKTLERLATVLEHPLFSDYQPLIVITIRRQPEIITSYYAHMSELLRGRQFNYDETFEDFLAGQMQESRRGFLLSLNFDVVADHCCQLFGKDNVFILPAEGIFEMRDREISILANMLNDSSDNIKQVLSGKNETPRNVKRNQQGVYRVKRKSGVLSVAESIYRGLNRMTGQRFGKYLLNAENRKKLRWKLAKRYEFSLTENQRKNIKEMYDNSNKKLDQIYQLGLNDYSYYKT